MSLRRSPQAVSTQVDDSAAVVLHLSTQAYFRLNGTAQVLWERLSTEEATTKADLVDALMECTDAQGDAVPRARVKQDVASFIASMRDADLVISEE
jgi:hypothetical protein